MFKNILKVSSTRFMPKKNKLSLSFYSLHFCFNKLKRIFNLYTKTISKHKKNCRESVVNSLKNYEKLIVFVALFFK